MSFIEGILVYDRENDRYYIRVDHDLKTGGLHCGNVLDIWVNEEWIPTRIEKNERWYLVGQRGILLDGIKVRRQS